MTVPEPLREFVAGAQSFIEKANNHDASVAAGNAEALLRTLQSYVAPTVRISEAFIDAIGRIAEFHEEVVDQNTLVRRITEAIENARQLAIAALDHLADELESAEPSQEAVALGLEWW